MTRAWSNWAGTARCSPQTYAIARSEADVATLVRAARERGVPVRAAGAGHSFAPLACTPGMLVDVRRLRGVLAIGRADAATGAVTVTVGAGTPLGELAAALHLRGLTVHGLPTTTAPTLAGAVATGTHGGGRHASLSAQVVGFRVVTGTGDMRDVDLASDLLPAFRVSLGALGVVTRVAIRCVPGQLLERREADGPLDGLLADPVRWAASAEHVSAFWFPWQDRVRHRTLRPAPDARPSAAVSPVVTIRDDLLRGWALRAAGARTPLPRAAAQRLAELCRPAPAPPHRGPAHTCCVFPQRLRFAALEYGIPLERLPEAVERLRVALRRTGFTSVLPLEIRPGPAESTWLSPAQGRATAWINLAAPRMPGRDRWLRTAEEVLVEAGGRPHWAKQHSLDASVLHDRYRHWDHFRAARDAFDPDGVFRTPYLDRLLGS